MYFIFFLILVENPQLFLNPDFTEEDREILENIFIYKEKLLNEIKVSLVYHF